MPPPPLSFPSLRIVNPRLRNENIRNAPPTGRKSQKSGFPSAGRGLHPRPERSTPARACVPEQSPPTSSFRNFHSAPSNLRHCQPLPGGMKISGIPPDSGNALPPLPCPLSTDHCLLLTLPSPSPSPPNTPSPQTNGFTKTGRPIKITKPQTLKQPPTRKSIHRPQNSKKSPPHPTLYRLCPSPSTSARPPKATHNSSCENPSKFPVLFQTKPPNLPMRHPKDKRNPPPSRFRLQSHPVPPSFKTSFTPHSTPGATHPAPVLTFGATHSQTFASAFKTSAPTQTATASQTPSTRNLPPLTTPQNHHLPGPFRNLPRPLPHSAPAHDKPH